MTHRAIGDTRERGGGRAEAGRVKRNSRDGGGRGGEGGAWKCLKEWGDVNGQ